MCSISNSISTTHAVYYGVLTIHDSISPFPVTRHLFRMMCDKRYFTIFLEDLNYAISPTKSATTL